MAVRVRHWSREACAYVERACDLFPIDCGDLGEYLTVGRVDDRQPLTAFDPVAVNIYGMSLHMNTLLHFILLEATSQFCDVNDYTCPI